jgi:Holliday junction DNA helicase RuvB
LAPAWTHLGFAVPAGVFSQDPLELFQAQDLADGLGDEPGGGPQGGSGGGLADETGPQRIRNSR